MMIKTAYRFHFIIVLTFFIIILLFNLLTYSTAVKMYNVLTVSIITVVYFIINEKLIFRIFIGSGIVKIICSVLLLLIFYNIKDVLFHVIYHRLPEYNIVLFSYEIVPGNLLFKKNITKSCITVSVIALFVASFKFFTKKRGQDRSVIDDLQYRIVLSRINPHFFKSIFSTALGRSIIGQGDTVPQILIKLSDIISYILNKDDDDDDQDEFIPLQDEWKQVENFLNILKWKYGDSKVRILQDRKFSSTVKIPSLLLLTAIENANKYTDWREESPFNINVQHLPDAIKICVSNIFHPRERLKMPSTNFGLHALKERIFRYNEDYKLVFKEEENIFSINFIIKNND
jgi:hypothetical protein